VARATPISRARLAKLRQAVADRPDSAKAHLRLGTALHHAGLLPEAEKECRRAVELDPDDPRAWVNLGGVLLSTWDFTGCVDANQRAISCDSTLVEPYYNQGIGHLYLGQAAEMVGCFEKVLELDPDNPGGHYYLAVAMRELGRIDEARQSLQKATQFGFKPEPGFLKSLESENQGSLAASKSRPGAEDDATNN
jgi:Flp pilus assembly protein TadD